MIVRNGIRRLNFVCKPSFIQSCLLISLYGSLMFFVLNNLNPVSKLGMSVLIEYSKFMVGVSTVIAAFTAIYGVNSWVKHLKHAEYFKLIWEAKRVLGMYHLAYLHWSQHRGFRYKADNKSAIILDRQYLDELVTQQKSLSHACLNLDAIIFKGEFNWLEKSRDFIVKVNQYKELFLKGSGTVTDAKRSVELINEIQEDYECLFYQLEQLEHIYSK